MERYQFSLDQLKTVETCDVLIAGGGTAGAVAGISAARQGADTLIVEQYGALGGSQTLALVTPVMHTHIEGDPQSSAIAEEIRERMQKAGAAIEGDSEKGFFDTLTLKCVLEDMVNESGCRVLYHSAIIGAIKENERITHGVVFNSAGVCAIAARMFVDATADGALSVLSGAKYQSGNERGYNQAVSLRYIMEGVDSEAFEKYNIELGDKNQRGYPLLHAASDGSPRWKLNSVFRKAYEDGLLTLQDIKYFQCFSLPGRRWAIAFNCPELGAHTNVLDPGFMTNRQMEGKRAIRRLARFLKERVPGFENAYVSEIAPMLGVRESRRIECEYMLTGSDVAGYRKFDDYIASSNYPVDIHDAGDDKLVYAEAPAGEKYYHIPMRSLVAKGIDNLFVAGRCLGADFVAQSSARVQASCRAMGEAAGIAAAIAVSSGVAARDVGGADVREIMLKRGARFT